VICKKPPPHVSHMYAAHTHTSHAKPHKHPKRSNNIPTAHMSHPQPFSSASALAFATHSRPQQPHKPAQTEFAYTISPAKQAVPAAPNSAQSAPQPPLQPYSPSRPPEQPSSPSHDSPPNRPPPWRAQTPQNACAAASTARARAKLRVSLPGHATIPARQLLTASRRPAARPRLCRAASTRLAQICERPFFPPRVILAGIAKGHFFFSEQSFSRESFFFCSEQSFSRESFSRESLGGRLFFCFCTCRFGANLVLANSL
jgi:hypothetical protein